MHIRILYFSNKGKQLAEHIAGVLDMHDTEIVPKGSDVTEICRKSFRDRSALLFIGASGIAVRFIAPFVKDKLQDPPVIVIDEGGQYVIPILSGHIGGANELASLIADSIGASPVITTATDVSKAFAVDLFACENDLTITDRKGIAKVSSSALEGRPVTISIKDYPPQENVDVLITDSSEKDFTHLKNISSIILCPKRYAVGIGCRRGKSFDELREFADKVFLDYNIDINEIGAITTIDVKKDEEGLIRLSQYWRVPLLTFDASVLRRVQGEFAHSDRVLSAVGVDNVCERSAICAAGPDSKLIISKQVGSGITLAVAERQFSAY